MYFLSLLLLPLLTQSKIIELTADNFDDVVNANDFTFVIFHADPSISWHYFKDVERHLVSLDSLVTKRVGKNYGLVLATANIKKEVKLSVYSKKETLHAMVFSNDPVNFPPITYKGSFVAMHMYVYSLLIRADDTTKTHVLYNRYNFVDALLNRIGASYEVGTDSFVRDAVDEFVKVRFGGTYDAIITPNQSVMTQHTRR